jgi:hypothetical protein
MAQHGLGWALWQTALTWSDSWKSGCKLSHLWLQPVDGVKRCARCSAIRRG